MCTPCVVQVQAFVDPGFDFWATLRSFECCWDALLAIDRLKAWVWRRLHHAPYYAPHAPGGSGQAADVASEKSVAFLNLNGLEPTRCAGRCASRGAGSAAVLRAMTPPLGATIGVDNDRRNDDWQANPLAA